MAILEDVAREAGISKEEAIRTSEALLAGLHRRLVEYRDGNGDYLGELAWSELSDRGFFHLLGFVEQLSIRYSWDEGSIDEYLGRLPPADKWSQLSQETKNWKWKND